MAALLRRFPLGGIILGDVHRPEGPAAGFSGGRWVPCAGLRGNDDGVQRWCDCGRVLLVGSSRLVFLLDFPSFEVGAAAGGACGDDDRRGAVSA
jgi:hypothetical protein